MPLPPQLETVQSGILADPENAELQNLKTELEEVISLTTTAIAELKPASAAAAAASNNKNQPAPPHVIEKWSKEKHPAYQAGYRPPNAPPSPVVEEPPHKFSVNDPVLAKWKSGDKAFYPARITSITGSSSKPVYIVTFKNYSTTETLSAADIKPVSNQHPDSKKRKADGSSTVSSSSPSTAATTPAAKSTGVISAAADINPTLASQAKREPSKVSDGPIRPAKVPRKVKANRELEAGKSKWQEFSAKGAKAGKVGKKESMFRTPEGVNARGKSDFFLWPLSLDRPLDLLSLEG